MKRKAPRFFETFLTVLESPWRNIIEIWISVDINVIFSILASLFLEAAFVEKAREIKLCFLLKYNLYVSNE
jgi:hypothetical protein